MNKTVYIDSDSLLYRAAHINTMKDEAREEALNVVEDEADDLGLPDAVDDTQEAMQRTFMSMVNEIMEAIHKVQKDVNPVPVLVLTVKPSSNRCIGMDNNFRYEVMDEVPDNDVKGYKQNRAGMEVPVGLEDIYNWVFDLPNSYCEEGVEADDVCVYFGRQGHIVAALDKDVLGSLEMAYNYGKREWAMNTPEQIALFPFYQTIIGDSSDGLRGVYRVGPKKADVALEGLVGDYPMWTAVVKQYFLKGQTLEEAIATMRCVRMDQWTPENGLVLWEPPTKGDTND